MIRTYKAQCKELEDAKELVKEEAEKTGTYYEVGGADAAAVGAKGLGNTDSCGAA
ncbi:MAG: hypothetical protein U5K54_06940 [Cytophagales bacterium]|nr:hypothetical protein [Cytophagales bacterium]